MKIPWPDGIAKGKQLTFLIGLVIGLVTIIGSWVMVLQDPHIQPDGKTAANGRSADQHDGTAASSGTTKVTKSGVANATASNANAANADNMACQRLSLATARQIIGQHAQNTDESSNSTTDIQTVTCNYASDSATLSLEIHVPLTHLGVSDNALAFGSEKPAGVQTVTDYGQAAYWDATQGKLHVLSENNWYIMHRGPDASLQDVKVVADNLQPKL